MDYLSVPFPSNNPVFKITGLFQVKLSLITIGMAAKVKIKLKNKTNS